MAYEPPFSPLQPAYANFLQNMPTFGRMMVKPATANAAAASTNAAAKDPNASPTIANAGRKQGTYPDLVSQIPSGPFVAGGTTRDEVGRITSQMPTMTPMAPIAPRITPQATISNYIPPGAAGGATADDGTKFTASTTSAPGISRVDVPGQSPMFTNLNPAYAVDDLNKKRSTPLPSVAGFMGGLKEGSLGLLAPSARAQGWADERMARANTLYDRADAVGSSGGLVDLWKARGMRRTAKGFEDTAIAADSNDTNRQANAIRERGQDMQFQVGMRGVDANLRGQDMGFLPHIGDYAMGKNIADRLAAGDVAGATELYQMKNPRQIQAPEYTVAGTDALGNPTSVLDKRSGVVTDLRAQQLAKTREEQAAKLKAQQGGK